GTIRDVSVEGAPPGTLVEVADLFFNTPARRKFLKTIATEMAHIADTASAMAMGWPSVGFTLSHNGKSLFLWPPAATPADRVREVLGADLAKGLIPLSLEAPHVSATGFLVPPDVSRSTGRGLFVFVNGRLVRDRVATHAVSAGYGSRLMKGRRPVAAVFLSVPADEVDVNVHPTKAEVRFALASLVHDALARAVDQALSGASRGSSGPDGEKIPVSWRGSLHPAARPPETAPPPPRSATYSDSPAPPESRTQAPERSAFPLTEPEPARPPLGPWGSHGPSSRIEEVLQAAPAPSPRPEPSSGLRGQTALAFSGPEEAEAGFSVVGRLAPCYILVQCRGGLLLVDQHAAHERILFERFSGFGEGGRPESQALLLPETVELSHAEAEALEPLLPGLSRTGLDVERFSGRTFVVKSQPAMLSGCGLGELVRGIAEEAVAVGTSGVLDRVLSAAYAHMACRGAIKAGERLAPLEMERLVRDLLACRNPGQCPHGRPVWLWWSPADLEKAFGRK
ncbi:MAG: DNA mismatch repair endonuclease MutL, partial [Pseudomonadota bacterium]